ANNDVDFLGVAAVPNTGNSALGYGAANGNVVYVYSGGATVDTNGFSVTAFPAFVGRDGGVTGSNVASVAVASAGSGYSIAPIVSFSGGGGSGAAGVATLDGNGGIAAIIVTDPGIGYSSAPTASLSGGTLIPGGVAASLGTVTIRDARAGGLTKLGS